MRQATPPAAAAAGTPIHHRSAAANTAQAPVSVTGRIASARKPSPLRPFIDQ